MVKFYHYDYVAVSSNDGRVEDRVTYCDTADLDEQTVTAFMAGDIEDSVNGELVSLELTATSEQ